jgi:hypothetical protein
MFVAWFVVDMASTCASSRAHRAKGARKTWNPFSPCEMTCSDIKWMKHDEAVVGQIFEVNQSGEKLLLFASF